MSDLRVTEKFDRVNKEWIKLRMGDLQLGDIFRLIEDDGKILGNFRADGEPYTNEDGIFTIIGMPFDVETWTAVPMDKAEI